MRALSPFELVAQRPDRLLQLLAVGNRRFGVLGGVTDVAFGWSTTLHFDATTFHAVAKALSTPWAWLFPHAVPSAQLVELAVPEFDELAGINAAGGFSAAESWAWHADLVERRGAGYDPRVLSRILRGRDFTARAYLELQKQRTDWQRRVMARLGDFDGWLMPTVPLVAPRIADLVADEALYFTVNGAMLRNPAIVNFMDGCAISVPCHQPADAPVGLSLAGPPLHDSAILGWAAAIENALNFHH